MPNGTGRIEKGKVMKTKTLMTMAVAGTFGLSAAAFAGSNHEVVTPFSISEAGENIFAYQKGFSGSDDQSLMASASDEASGSVNGNALISSESSGSMDESLALADEGIYSDFYVVSWTPVVVESWDLYVINTGDRDELAAADESDI